MDQYIPEKKFCNLSDYNTKKNKIHVQNIRFYMVG